MAGTVLNRGFSGQKTVTAAGTAEQLISTNKTGKIRIKALNSNSGAVFIAFTTGDLSLHYSMLKNEYIDLELGVMTLIYVDAAVNGEGVCYIGTETA